MDRNWLPTNYGSLNTPAQRDGNILGRTPPSHTLEFGKTPYALHS